MNDALLVGAREPVGDLDCRLDRLAQRQRASLEPLAQRLAVEQLGDRVRGRVPPPEIDDREEVRVGESRDRPGLALEAGQRLFVLREPRGEYLHGDVACEPRVTRTKNLSHSAGAERGDDLVVADARSRRESHGSSGTDPSTPGQDRSRRTITSLGPLPERLGARAEAAL